MAELHTFPLSPMWDDVDLTVDGGHYTVTIPLLGSRGPWTTRRTDEELVRWLQGPAGEKSPPDVESVELRRTLADELAGKPSRTDVDHADHRQNLTITFLAGADEFREFAGERLRALVEYALQGLMSSWAEDQATIEALVDELRAVPFKW